MPHETREERADGRSPVAALSLRKEFRPRRSEVVAVLRDVDFAAEWGAVMFLLVCVQTVTGTMAIMTANAGQAEAIHALRERAAAFRSEMTLPW